MSQLTEKLKLTLDYDELTNCMRCGFCIPACPTYRETGLEAASPRGRIALMKAAVDGLMDPDEGKLRDQLNLCLGCRACEIACPSGVKYGHLLEQARDVLEEKVEYPWWIEKIRTLVFRYLFPSQRKLQLLGSLMAFYQRSGLAAAARKLGLLRFLPKQVRDMEAILPKATGKGVVEQLGTIIPAKGEKVATVALFRGCIMDVLFTETNKNTVRLLTEAGCEVIIPSDQNCCGALHAHSGQRNLAKELARKNVEVFYEAGVDYIVSNAGGCGAMLKEYDHLLKDEELGEKAKWFAERVKDISEILIDIAPLKIKGTMNRRVTYQDSCHLRNVMKVSSQPRKLLRQVDQLEYKELFEADRCCGSAGIYNIIQPEMSMSLLDHKMENVSKTKADVIVTANPGCLLQMKLGVHREGLSDQVETVHIVDLIAEAIELEKKMKEEGSGCGCEHHKKEDKSA